MSNKISPKQIYQEDQKRQNYLYREEHFKRNIYIQLFTNNNLVPTQSRMLTSSESTGCSLLGLARRIEFSEPVRFSQYRGSGVTKELLPAKAENDWKIKSVKC